MSESKELLEATIKGLEEKLDSLNADLRSKERELEVKLIIVLIIRNLQMILGVY